MTLRQLFYGQLTGNFIAGFIGFCVLCFSTYINGDYGSWDGPWPILIGVTIACTWMIRLHAFQEAIRIRNKITIVHWKRFIIRAIIAIVIGSMVHLYTEGINWYGIKYTLALAFYIGGLFWLLFDFMLNNDRHLPILYVSKWYQTAFTDKIFNGSYILWLVSKVAVFLFGLWFYLKITGA